MRLTLDTICPLTSQSPCGLHLGCDSLAELQDSITCLRCRRYRDNVLRRVKKPRDTTASLPLPPARRRSLTPQHLNLHISTPPSRQCPWGDPFPVPDGARMRVGDEVRDVRDPDSLLGDEGFRSAALMKHVFEAELRILGQRNSAGAVEAWLLPCTHMCFATR
jgi:hypothetical protein